MTALSAMKCIVCGKRAPAMGGLCAECLCERRRFVEVPDFCEVVLCAHCGSVHVGRRWENAESVEREVAEAARRAARVSGEEGVEVSTEVTVKPVNEHNADAEVEARIRIGRRLMRQSARTRVRIRRAVCERCSKIHGKYYEAILQVRAAGRSLRREELAMVQERVAELSKGKEDRQDFIAKVEERDGGVDFQLGKLGRGKAMVRTLAAQLGGRVTESSKITGNKEGRELYRVTFLLRLPGLRAGDFASLAGRVLMVTHVGPQGISAADLATGKEEVLDARAEEGARRLGGEEMVEVAVVLEARAPEVTIMDPVSYKPLSVVAPAWFWAKERPENVRILKVGEDFFLVPG